jgi:DNA-binding response OmpR family regulator
LRSADRHPISAIIDPMNDHARQRARAHPPRPTRGSRPLAHKKDILDAMHILVIEDNPDIAANIGDFLAEKGHIVDFAGDGVTGLHLAVVEDFDVIVLDLTLPGMDGLELCKKLRTEARKHTPVLMLTARDALPQKVAGFEAGADDYLVKPFALQELEMRINALGRRGRGPQARVLKVGDLEYNLDTYTVTRQGKQLQLNPTGLKLLQCLMESSPAVVTRRELEMRVWGEELPDSDSLRVHIHGLRAAIDKPFNKPLIHTRHGIGYSLNDPDAVPATAS